MLSTFQVNMDNCDNKNISKFKKKIYCLIWLTGMDDLSLLKWYETIILNLVFKVLLAY